MKKLFVFQNNHEAYRDEHGCAYIKVSNNKRKIHIDSLSIDYLREEDFDVVISNGLPPEWYLILKGMNVVTITIDSGEKYHEYSDIVIDCLSTDDRRYFTGKDYSFCRPNSLEIVKIDEIVDLITIREWSSNFFGFNIAYISCMHLTDNIVHRMNKTVKDENIRLIEYLCNCHDRRSVRVAEKNGFHFADIRLTFKKKMKSKENLNINGFIFERAITKDIPQLKEKISGDFYKDSRYFFDINFDLEKTIEFFKVWIEKGVLGTYDDECWCLYDKSEIAAYSTLWYDNQKSAYIGLLGVDKKYQGNGLGKKILCCINNLLVEKNIPVLFVVTQGRNYAAQRLYQGAGFRTKSTQLWYHKWIR